MNTVDIMDSGHFLFIVTLCMDRAAAVFPLAMRSRAEDVFTRLLPWAALLPFFEAGALRRAVFAGRKRRPGCSGLVRALWRHELGDLAMGFRFSYTAEQGGGAGSALPIGATPF
jgi:hypothetical protein